LEVFLGGEWGTICDDGWEFQLPFSNAAVACAQLGYSRIGKSLTVILLKEGILSMHPTSRMMVAYSQ
jgi:hypothetical protein